jgi:hypothetical protein
METTCIYWYCHDNTYFQWTLKFHHKHMGKLFYLGTNRNSVVVCCITTQYRSKICEPKLFADIREHILSIFHYKEMKFVEHMLSLWMDCMVFCDTQNLRWIITTVTWLESCIFWSIMIEPNEIIGALYHSNFLCCEAR